jgi:hypothetical protein
MYIYRGRLTQSLKAAYRQCSSQTTTDVPIPSDFLCVFFFWGQVDTFLAGGVETMSDVPIRYSIYLLYWYKSTNTDAEGAASWSRPVRKRLMAASKMKSAGQMLGLLAGLKVC